MWHRKYLTQAGEIKKLRLKKSETGVHLVKENVNSLKH